MVVLVGVASVRITGRVIESTGRAVFTLDYGHIGFVVVPPRLANFTSS
jgi:hypothetical protein